MEEGKNLFYLEKSAWYGTDYFLKNFPNRKNEIGGYLSYRLENQMVNIFYGREDKSKILARIFFDLPPKENPMSVDTLNTMASNLERELIMMRENTLEIVNSDKENFFSHYKNTSYNIIPMISGAERKVYIITGAQVSGVVVLGNDYLLTFDKKGKLKKKEKIHNSIIELPIADKEGNFSVNSIHSHVNSKYIDPTDICTLLLFKDYVKWEQHTVIGKKYVSIFDLKKEELVILKFKDWEKIMGRN